jgi:hypothetical protein
MFQESGNVSDSNSMGSSTPVAPFNADDRGSASMKSSFHAKKRPDRRLYAYVTGHCIRKAGETRKLRRCLFHESGWTIGGTLDIDRDTH